jgi:hypothetical protein
MSNKFALLRREFIRCTPALMSLLEKSCASFWNSICAGVSAGTLGGVVFASTDALRLLEGLGVVVGVEGGARGALRREDEGEAGGGARELGRWIVREGLVGVEVGVVGVEEVLVWFGALFVASR